MAKIRLDEAVNLGLVDPSVYFGRGGYGRYGYSVPRRAGGFAGGGGGIQGGVPFWRLPPFLQSAIFQPRFGLGPLRLGLGLSPSAPAVGAPGAVPVGRPAARRQLSPEEQAIIIERLRAVGALPQPSLGRRAPIPVGRGQTPAAAARTADRAPVQATDAGVAGDLADAFALRQALAQAETVAKLGGRVAQAIAGPEPGFLEGVSPEAQAALAEQRAGERGDVAPRGVLEPVAGGFRLPSGEVIRNPSALGGPFPFPGYVPQEFPSDGIQLSPELLEELGIIPGTGGLPAGRAVGAGPVAGPGAARRFARAAVPAFRGATAGLNIASGALGLAEGQPQGALPLASGLTTLGEQAGVIPSRFAETAGPALGLAGAGFGVGQGIEAGDPGAVARGILSGTQAAAALPAVRAAFPAASSLVGKLAGPAGIALGIATKDPGAIAAGVGSLGGALAGGSAAAGATAAGASAAQAAALGASTAGLVAAPLVLVPALSMFFGAQRAATIERQYAKRAKEAVAGFRGDPDIQAIGSNIARLRGGDDSIVDSLQRALGTAIRTGFALRQPQGGSSAGVEPIIRGIYSAVRGGPHETSTLIAAGGAALGDAGPGAATVQGRTAAENAYDLLREVKFAPPTPPPGYRPPAPQTLTPLGGIVPVPAIAPPFGGAFTRSGPTTPPSEVPRQGFAAAAVPIAYGGPFSPALPPQPATLHKGGIVPSAGQYRLKAGEAVLPAEVVSAIGRVLAQGPAQGGEQFEGEVGRLRALDRFRQGIPSQREGDVGLPRFNPFDPGRNFFIRGIDPDPEPGGTVEPPFGAPSVGATAQGEPVPQPRPGPPPFDPTAPASPGAGERFPAAARALTAGPGAIRPTTTVTTEYDAEIDGRNVRVRMERPLGPDREPIPPSGEEIRAAVAEGGAIAIDPLRESDERASRVWRILQGHPRPGDPNIPWFVDSRRGVPFQGANNPDPDRVWRLVFSPAELAEAWPDRGSEGWPILLRPSDLDFGDQSFVIIERARQEQYEHPGFRIDFLRERGYPPEEYRTAEEESGALRAFGEARRSGLGKQGFIDVGDELEGLGEEDLAENERRQREIDEAANPRMPQFLEPEAEPELLEEEEDLAGAAR